VSRFILTSSGAVYGNAPFGDTPVTEDTAPTPQSLYAFSKLGAERLAVQYRAAWHLDVVRTRLTAIYGPWEHDTGVRDTLSPPLQVALAAVQSKPVVVADGGMRDWTSGTDIARALVCLLEAPSTRHDLYNLGCGETWHPELLCQALKGHFPAWSWRRGVRGETPSVAYNDALDRPRRSPPSSQRFTSEFGPLFRRPAAGAEAYAAWIAAHGAAFAGA
jgi:UDP-glucose 4-epimerase